jgi:hypothetical protein
MIPASERAKTVHALDRLATVTVYVNIIYIRRNVTIILEV